VNGGGGYGCMADRNAQLTQVRHDVAGRVQLFDACLLMIINPQASDVIASCSQLERHLRTNGATKRRIEDVNLQTSPITGIHAHGVFSR
jgi:hypothetical protein